jgi:hypothetical protein
VTQPRTAFHVDRPCQLNRYHAPEPVMTEFHHRRPVFLQNRLYGRVRYGPDLWVCSNCHDSIHAWLYWLLGEHRRPPYIGRNAKAEAQRTFNWYVLERMDVK